MHWMDVDWLELGILKYHKTMEITYLVINIGYELLIGRFSNVAQFGCIFGRHQAIISYQCHALGRHRVSLHVNLLGGITCKSNNKLLILFQLNIYGRINCHTNQ